MPGMLYLPSKTKFSLICYYLLLFYLHSLLLMASKADVSPLKMEEVVKTSGYKTSVVVTQLISAV